jgi:hypothetical protein
MLRRLVCGVLTLVVGMAAFAGVSAAAPAGGHQHHLTYFAQAGDESHRSIRPHHMEIAGDGRFSTTHNHWSAWGSSRAAGHAELHQFLCSSNNCPQAGHERVSRIHLVLTKPVKRCGRYFFSRMTYRRYHAHVRHRVGLQPDVTCSR